jgi:hypothetical protein
MPCRLAVAATGLALVAWGGCTDEGLSARERDYAEAFARDLADEDDGFGVDEEGGRCIAGAVMAELGSEPFEEAGVEPEDLAGDEAPGELLGEGAVTDEQADAVVAAWHRCVDLPARFAEQAGGEFGLDDPGVACFEDALRDDDVLDRYLRVSFTSERRGDAEAVLGDLVVLVQGCTAAAGGGGGILVDSIAASLAADGGLTAEQAGCVAQQVVDLVGAERLIEVTGPGGFETAPADVQDELAQAIVDATAACGIPASQLGG